MELQIRLADSGHSETITIQRSSKGESLISKIEYMYKINPKDQILITKIGHIIEPNQILEKAFTSEMQDKTLVSSSFNDVSSHKKNDRISCISIFNLKQLNKPDENSQEKSKLQWAQELKQKLFQPNDKSVIFPNEEEFQKKYSSQQQVKYDKFIKSIISIKESYKKIAREYSDLKDSGFKIQRVIQRCNVQKKSANTLIKSMKMYVDNLIDKQREVYNLKEQLKSKFTIDDKSLRENSGFFESKKKNQNSLAVYDKQYQHLKEKIESYLSKIKQQSRTVKSRFRLSDSKSMEYGKRQYDRVISEINSSNKKEYDQMVHLFNQLVQNGASIQSKSGMLLQTKISKLQENIKKVLLPQYEQMCQELTNSFFQLNKLNEINKNTVKQIFHWYHKITIPDLRNFMSQLKMQQKILKGQIQKEKKRKVSIFGNQNSEGIKKMFQDSSLMKKQNRDDAEFTRRVKFIKSLNFIQSFATKMCFQEECQRKKYLNELKNNKCQYQFLKNVKVRQIDFDDNNSSDLELIKLIKSSNAIDFADNEFNAEQFMLFNYNWILQKIKSGNVNETNGKIKNMQQILKRMSDIFTKVYNNKIDELINGKQQIQSKIPQLQQKINTIQNDLDKSKTQVVELHRRLVEKQQLLISRQKQRSQQINKQRKRYEKLSIDFKQLQKKLNKQIETTQQLYNQVLKSDEEIRNSNQLNQYLKELLAQKELQIIQIQKKLTQNEHDKVQLIQPVSFKQNDLKSAVLQDFGKNITKDSAQKQKQIEKLNQEITLLQRQNEELQQQNDSLQSQLRKIITKQTQDIEIQVNTQQPSYKIGQKDSISISQDIIVGQNAIFMPFSNSLYVGVSHKDDNRTVCNVNNIQSNHYILDLSTFNLKTKELLSQCSFLVVLHVTNLFKQGKNIMVKGQIRYLLGFQDDNLSIKNYTNMLPV